MRAQEAGHTPESLRAPRPPALCPRLSRRPQPGVALSSFLEGWSLRTQASGACRVPCPVPVSPLHVGGTCGQCPVPGRLLPGVPTAPPEQAGAPTQPLLRGLGSSAEHCEDQLWPWGRGPRLGPVQPPAHGSHAGRGQAAVGRDRGSASGAEEHCWTRSSPAPGSAPPGGVPGPGGFTCRRQQCSGTCLRPESPGVLLEADADQAWLSRALGTCAGPLYAHQCRRHHPAGQGGPPDPMFQNLTESPNQPSVRFGQHVSEPGVTGADVLVAQGARCPPGPQSGEEGLQWPCCRRGYGC